MTRLVFRFAAVACVATLASACGGGGGSRAVPVLPVQAAGQQPEPAGTVNVPESSLRGVMVTVHLPLRNSDQLDALIARQGDQTSPDYHRFLTPTEFRTAYGPSAHDVATAATALQTMGFQTRATSQSIVAAAPQAAVERAFAVKLLAAQPRGRSTASLARSAMSADRTPTLPAALTKVGATVSFAGLVRHVDARRVSTAPYIPANRYSTTGPYWFTDLKQAYGYPSYETVKGSGRRIAIVDASDLLDSDLALYFGHELLAPPTIERRWVDGGPVAFDPNSGDAVEASLDVQQAFGSAPGARIILYGTPDLSDQSVQDAYTAIVEDNKADVVSSSFGLCELYYTKAYNGGTDYTSVLRQMHDTYRQGNAQGITFLSASGDNGAYDCFDPTGSFLVKGVESAADDPNNVGVGGTNLVTKSIPGSVNSSYVRESAYFDTYDPRFGALPNEIFGSGGGISVVFAKPSYQLLVDTHANTRTVPDVAMQMGGCPEGAELPCNPDDSSVVVAVGGQFYEVVGTSVSSPEFAGLLAVTEQRLGTRLGEANSYIYALSRFAGSLMYHQDIPGNNGYPTTHGYNYVLGNGTPHAADFALDPFGPRAGNPGTPSNP
jgi:subtilase family serine protease